MSLSFARDPYPGKPKILFIGLGESSHSQGWIDLLTKEKINVRMFALPSGFPPADWRTKTYVSGFFSGRNNSLRKYMYSGIAGKIKARLVNKMGREVAKSNLWLSKIIASWRPDIIHTLGLFDNQGGQFYLQTRKKYHLQGYGKWVVQLRGGSDMALRRHNPEYQKILREVLTECEQIICDNQANTKYAADLGIPRHKFAAMVPVPGSGGLDLGLVSQEMIRPSQRERIILWPKAYECAWSKALPVLEAMQTAWEKIKPCQIYMLAITPDVYEWYLSLPAEIQQCCHLSRRIPRQEMLSLLQRARVLLAPSLIDGVPNSLYEAMAYGAFPIVSPLETIVPVVKADENVLFARNLYPDEIAQALVRAMNDDALIDQAAENNLRLIGEIANREIIGKKVVDFYNNLWIDE